MLYRAFIALFLLLIAPGAAWAIIPHNYPGYYPHQIAHVIFLAALLIFVYYLKRQGLTRERGWQYIALASVLLALWNLHAFIGHIVELGISSEDFVNRGDFVKGALVANRTTVFYYIYKFDNLILAPAIFFFYAGVRWHLKKGTK